MQQEVDFQKLEKQLENLEDDQEDEFQALQAQLKQAEQKQDNQTQYQFNKTQIEIENAMINYTDILCITFYKRWRMCFEQEGKKIIEGRLEKLKNNIKIGKVDSQRYIQIVEEVPQSLQSTEWYKQKYVQAINYQKKCIQSKIGQAGFYKLFDIKKSQIKGANEQIQKPQIKAKKIINKMTNSQFEQLPIQQKIAALSEVLYRVIKYGEYLDVNKMDQEKQIFNHSNANHLIKKGCQTLSELVNSQTMDNQTLFDLIRSLQNNKPTRQSILGQSVGQFKEVLKSKCQSISKYITKMKNLEQLILKAEEKPGKPFLQQRREKAQALNAKIKEQTQLLQTLKTKFNGYNRKLPQLKIVQLKIEDLIKSDSESKQSEIQKLSGRQKQHAKKLQREQKISLGQLKIEITLKNRKLSSTPLAINIMPDVVKKLPLQFNQSLQSVHKLQISDKKQNINEWKLQILTPKQEKLAEFSLSLLQVDNKLCYQDENFSCVLRACMAEKFKCHIVKKQYTSYAQLEGYENWLSTNFHYRLKNKQ